MLTKNEPVTPVVYVVVRYYALATGGVNHLCPSDPAFQRLSRAEARARELNHGQDRGPYGVITLEVR